MSGPALRRVALLCGLLVFAACAGPRVRPPPADAAALARQAAREAALATRAN